MTTIMNGNAEAGSMGAREFEHVTCPFCGLLCDDLTVRSSGGRLAVAANGCPKAAAGFERPLPEASPRHHGRDVSLGDAIAAAAGMLRGARLPLIGGLATDVEGLRAALSLADRAGGVVDHALSEAAQANIDVLQTTGWVMSTLTEVRNRADLVIVVASDIARFHPRFFERVVAPPLSLIDDAPPKRTVVFIGSDIDTAAAASPRVGEIVTLACPNARAAEVVAALRATLRGARLAQPTTAGVPASEIAALAERCRKASYGVLVWVPPALDPATAGLTVQSIADLARDLTREQRFVGLSLGGDEGAASAQSVCCWQSGFPLRVSYASGTPRHDPVRYSIPRMLARGDGDLLVWIASFTPTLVPPPTTLPTIVLGTPGLAMPAAPSVFIPVGTPGVDHVGRLIRNDSVVSLPLRNLNRAPLPSTAKVLTAIEAAL